MELREFKYMSQPAGNSASSASSSAGNKSFKKRFEKLINYYGDHLPAEVDFVYVNLLTNGSLNFTENYDNGDKVQYDIFIDDFDTEDWGIKIKVNGQPTEKYFDKGWSKLLNTLGAYIELPQAGDPEYNNLLTEWVVMNNKPSSSGSYKKRFEKLIKYHIDHASSELERVNNKVINDYGFHLSEHYNTGSEEFNRTIIVSVNKYTEEFFLSIFVDGKEVYHNVYKSYEECIQALAEDYMYLPDSGTPGYDDLLVEFVVMKTSSSTSSQASQPASSNPNKNKDKFYDLISYMQQHKLSTVTSTKVDRLDNTGFEYEEHREPTKAVAYDLRVEVTLDKYDLFTIRIYQDGEHQLTYMPKGWENFLLYLKRLFNVPATGSLEHTALIESELNEWQLINPPKASQPASSTTLYKNKFKKLLDYHLSNDYHIKHGSSQGTVELLSEDSDKALFKFKDTWMSGSTIHETVIAAAYFKKDASWWILKIVDGEQKESIDGNGFNELVKKLYRYFTLPATNSSEYQALLEEADSSIADDFKLYENLWD